MPEILREDLSILGNMDQALHLPIQLQNQAIRSALVLKLHQFEDTGAIMATTTSIPEAQNLKKLGLPLLLDSRRRIFVVSLAASPHFEELEKFILYLHSLVEESRIETISQPVYGIDGTAKLTEKILDSLPGFKGNKPVRVGNQPTNIFSMMYSARFYWLSVLCFLIKDLPR